MPGFKKSILLLGALGLVTGAWSGPLRAQDQVPSASPLPCSPVTLTAEVDHTRMMKLLGITSLRPRVNGMNPTAPNRPNYDESKANPYAKLPDPLLTVDAGDEFMAAAAAQEVYGFLGVKGLGTGVTPPVGEGLLDGEIAFGRHNGGHTDRPNWPFFLDFVARYFEAGSGRFFVK